MTIEQLREIDESADYLHTVALELLKISRYGYMLISDAYEGKRSPFRTLELYNDAVAMFRLSADEQDLNDEASPSFADVLATVREWIQEAHEDIEKIVRAESNSGHAEEAPPPEKAD